MSIHTHDDGTEHDQASDIFLDLKDAKPLLEEDIEWGIAYHFHEDGWMRREVVEAASDEEAVACLKQQGHLWGSYGQDGCLDGTPGGMIIKRKWRGGVVKYEEIVRRLRSNQPTLF